MIPPAISIANDPIPTLNAPEVPASSPDQIKRLPTIFYTSKITAFLDEAKRCVEKIRNAALSLFDRLHERVTTTPLPPLVEKTFSLATQIEKIFNVAACVPFFGVAFSSIRVIAGKVQLVSGTALMLIGKMGFLVCSQFHSDEDISSKWKTISNLGSEHVIHGALNILRGLGEGLLCFYTFGVGNLVLLVPNLRNEEPFTPFFTYGITLKPDVKEEPLKNIVQ